MITVEDIVADGELAAPKPFQILRSTGQWVLGGFTSTTATIPQIGPVQRASDKEVQMLPEGDRTGGIMAFWCTLPIYTTRGRQPDPSTVNQVPVGTLPGNTFTLAGLPTDGSLFINGLQQIPFVDYVLASGVLTTVVTVQPGSILLFTSAVVDEMDGPAAADILVYPPNEVRYRVLSVRHYPGSGYWKALGTQMGAT